MPDDKGQDPDETTSPVDDSTATDSALDAPAADTRTTTEPRREPTVEELRRARDDAAKYRTQLREAQAKLKEHEEAQVKKDEAEKSELQKALDRAAELEVKEKQATGKVKSLALKNSVLLAAQKMDIVDPDAAFRLLDADKVEYDGDEPANIDDLLETLVNDKPYLKRGTAKGSAAPTSPTQPVTKTGKALTAEDIAQMTDDEINARWDEVKKVLAASGKR